METELTVVKNATCTFCGCVCDDIELHADGERIVKTKHACSLGESWFKQPHRRAALPRRPDRRQAGHASTRRSKRRPSILHAANMPLVYGMSNITCEAQREAVALAELVGGVIDSHTSL